MRQIYSRATNVIVFLGDGGTHASSHLRLSRPQEFVFRGDWSDSQYITQFLFRCRAMAPHKLRRGFGVFCLISLFAQQQEKHIQELLSLETTMLQQLFEDLRMMLLSRWWNRMWVFQEVIVSRGTLVQYGFSVAPLELFVRAARNIQKLDMEDSLYNKLSTDNIKVLHWFAESIVNIQQSRRSHNSIKDDNFHEDYSGQLLLTLLRATSNRKASDERDKIYALLGLLPLNLGISPNYHIETPRLYTEVVRNIIAATGSLNVLCGDLGRKNRGDLPSWVPDWSAIIHNEELRRTKVIAKLYNACGRTKFACYTSLDSFWEVVVDNVYIRQSTKMDDEEDEPQHMRRILCKELRRLQVKAYYPRETTRIYHKYSTDKAVNPYRIPFGHLRISAAYVDCIEYCSDQFLDPTKVSLLKSLLMHWQWLQGKKKSTPEIDTATLKALVFDAKLESGEFKRLKDDDEIELQSWFKARTSPKSQAYQDKLGFDHVLKFMSTRRRLFMTSNGVLGWGPEGLKIGDQMYVLPGGRTPYVLRGLSEEYLDYDFSGEMVGDCYLHGVMDGQYAEHFDRGGKVVPIFRELCMSEFKAIRQLFGPKLDDIASKYSVVPLGENTGDWDSTTNLFRNTNILLI
ncbi:hypothetical protein F4811DRAFT_534894 [Daldinia bambusicola]|nr:hypothetical protein F4811DRAFT_534894 [Daldinia bambusicola]